MALPVVRVYELAQELDLPSHRVLAWLRSRGINVLSASSRVNPDEARLIRAQFAPRQLGRRPVRPNPFSQSASPLTAEEQEIAQVARNLGIPPEALLPSTKPRDRKPAGRSIQRTRPIDDWLWNLIDNEEKSEWLQAGLGPDDARLARQCKDEGLQPADLQLRVDGVIAAVRLRGGESVPSVRSRIVETQRRLGESA